jgi:hypothetical protein
MRNYIKLIKRIALISCCVLACFAITGCSSNSSFEIGTQESNGADFSATNNTEQAITQVKVRTCATEQEEADSAMAGSVEGCDWTETLAQESDWEAGKSANVHIPASVLTDGMCDIQITLADGMKYSLHGIPVAKSSDFTFGVSDGYAYVEYRDGSNQVSTLDTEKSFKEDVQKIEDDIIAQQAAEEEAALKAEQEAAEQAAAEQAAAEAAQAAAASNSNSSSNNTSSSNGSSSSGTSSKSSSSNSNGSGSNAGSESGSNDSSSASDGEDICVDDLIFN